MESKNNIESNGIVVCAISSFFLGIVFAYVVPTVYFAITDPPIPDLHRAARRGDLLEVKKILENGYPVDTEDLEWEDTALFAAARKGSIEVVKELVANGADINHKASTGATPLSEAFAGGNEEVIKFLVERGAVCDYEVMKLNYLNWKSKKLPKTKVS